MHQNNGVLVDATKLPPDPENLNDKRAEWAMAALVAFKNKTGSDIEDGCAVADLLADLHHWCDRAGLSFEHLAMRGEAFYSDETTEEETTENRKGQLAT